MLCVKYRAHTILNTFRRVEYLTKHKETIFRIMLCGNAIALAGIELYLRQVYG